MTNYYRVMLGSNSIFAKECFAGNFVGTSFGIHQDLASRLTEDFRTFNADCIPIYLVSHPGKSKIAAGLACGSIWTVGIGMKFGDVVLSPDGAGTYRIGDVSGSYAYEDGQSLPHRRPVTWRDQTIGRDAMSPALRASAGSVLTAISLSPYQAEIEALLAGVPVPELVATDKNVEDPIAFALEKHLEDFLVANWAKTELGTRFEIYSENGMQAGQQYPSDTGPIDILAISNDKKHLLVVELKRGRASDVVVGQILRYMGYVKEVLAEAGQAVEGVIIALDDDQRIRRALAMTPSITFYRYEVTFRLVKV